jgi:hypothetical protein
MPGHGGPSVPPGGRAARRAQSIGSVSRLPSAGSGQPVLKVVLAVSSMLVRVSTCRPGRSFSLAGLIM